MKEKSNLLTLILVSVITAVVVGGAAYLWQESKGSLNDNTKIPVVEEEVEKEEEVLNKYQDLFRKHLYKAHFSQWYLVSNKNGIDKYEMSEEMSTTIDALADIGLSINEDGSFKMFTKDHPYFSKDPNVEDGGLLGTWELSENGELTLSFDNGDKIEYEILLIDENNLKMERKSSTVTALNYTYLSVCGEFEDYEVATDSGFYSVARSAENGDCLFMLSATSSRNDGECAFDEMEYMVNPNRACITSIQKFYNSKGEEIEELEIAASKPIWQEDYNNAITK